MTIHRYGWRRQALDHRDLRYRLRNTDTSNLPPAYVQPSSRKIMDQGNLGSCTAHGGERAINNLRIRAGLPVVAYSRLAIYYDTRAREDSIESDAGGEIRDVVKTLAAKGAILESDWPYVESQFAIQPPAAAYSSVEIAVAYQSLDNTDLGALKHCLAIEHDPIIFGFSVFDGYENLDSTGLVPMPSAEQRPLGGHCNVIEGYDDSVTCPGASGRGAFWVANSWGTGWGSRGYCWIPYSYLCNDSLASDCWHIAMEQTLSN